jgi:hypothetical protein
MTLLLHNQKIEVLECSETSIFITSFTHFLPKINQGAELIVVETTIKGFPFLVYQQIPD